MNRGFIFTLFILLCQLACTSQSRIEGTAIRIIDGDTFELLTSNKRPIRIRLFGIDAPEKNQEFGTASKQVLASRIFQKKVIVEKVNTDRNGRMVAVVYCDGVDINLYMIRSGMAWHFTRYSKRQDYANAEQAARSEKVGLWSHASPIAPWDFRHQK